MMRHARFFIGFVLLFITGSVDGIAAEKDLPALIEQVKPAVVTIIVYDKDDEVISQGSGFFVAKNRLVTNRHVMKGVDHARYKLISGASFPIKGLLASDDINDLVLLSVDTPKGPAKVLELSKTLPKVGQEIVVVSTPFGLEQTISNGIVSLIREIPELGDSIQITAPISPGSSGGPVIDKEGRVVGVVVSLISAGQNLNFAVPSRHVSNLKPGKLQLLSELKTSDISSEKTWFRIGFIYGELDRHTEALEAFKQAVRINPDFANAHLALGMTYNALKHPTEAIEAFKQAIRINPDNFEAHGGLGGAYLALKRPTEAIEAFKQAIRIKPDYASAHYCLGIIYGFLDRPTEAIDAYKQAIRINPDDAGAHLALGAAYGSLERYSEAMDAYKQAIQINPDNAGAHLGLGATYIFLKRYTKAIESYKQAIRIKPNHAGAHLTLGSVYGGLERYTEAMDAFKQAIRINPDDALAHYGMGIVYLATDRKGDALDEYRILKDLDKEKANKLFNEIYK